MKTSYPALALALTIGCTASWADNKPWLGENGVLSGQYETTPIDISNKNVMIPTPNDFEVGWCAGYAAAQQVSMQNRDHWRDLLGLPKRTHDEVIKEIYSRHWIGSMAPRTLDHPNEEPQVGPPLDETVDLYVVVPPLPGFDDESTLTVIIQDGRTLHCPTGKGQ